MKKYGKICIITALALLLALSTMAQAAMYVEGFLGGSTASNPGGKAPNVNRRRASGYVVCPEGVLGLDYPKWMKYFGFYTDVSL